MYKHAYIVNENGKYVVKSESGKNLGSYSTKEQAERRLEQVEWFKNREKTAAFLRAYELGCDLAIKVAEDGVATKSDPELWSRAKSEAKARMGGKHSARAMQLATKIYKDRGGDYAGKKPSASKNKMRKWTKQDWQTRPGTSEIAEKENGRTSRYLPKAKWDSLSKSEQKATDAKKLKSDKQYVDNTDAAKVKGNAKYIKESEAEFKPDISAADLKAMGVYDQVYGDAESEASMEKWPAHWLHEQDPLGWLQWYERYSQGRRTEDDARQIKRWASFKARHGSQYSKNPTPRRKAALRNWGIDADRLLDNMEKQSKVLTTRGRDRIKEKNFALDNRRYPIHDINHARAALSMVAKHGTPEEQAQVRKAVYAKYPGIANRAKQADYRDRATLLLHNGQGGVLAAKNQHPENPIYPPYFFPGGGVFKEEGIRNSVTEEEIQEGLRREALEEIGHKLKNIDSLGMQPIEVNMGDAWAAKQLAKKGVPYKGFREHIRAAMSDGIDNSILGSEGDDFTAYNPEYINANELASALESSLPGLRKAGDPTLVTSRLQTIEALKRLGNIKQANYRDRATLILHDNKGNVFAAPDIGGGDNEPYFFPGGGIHQEEGIHPLPDEDTIRKGLEREALEELGYKLKDIQDFGFKDPSIIPKSTAWQQRQLAKKGVPYKGVREHLRAAIMAGEDKSLHGSAGDDFHQWYPEYMEAGLLAKQLEDHNEKLKSTLDPSVYSSRAKKIEFIRNLAKEKTAYYIGRRLAIMSHS
jgi:8-oxo-dGTP pyrophosphatase MutT (NUDIX family)